MGRSCSFCTISVNLPEQRHTRDSDTHSSSQKGKHMLSNATQREDHGEPAGAEEGAPLCPSRSRQHPAYLCGPRAPAMQTDSGAATLPGKARHPRMPPSLPHPLWQPGVHRCRQDEQSQPREPSGPQVPGVQVSPPTFHHRLQATQLVLGSGKDTLGEAKAGASAAGEMAFSQQKLHLSDKLFK